MATKIRRDIEPRWVSEYILAHYPDAESRPRCPLGPIPKEMEELYGPEKARRAYRPSRPEADALVILKDKLILIEGKIQKLSEGLSKLPMYKSLIPETPELQAYKTLPVEMHLLVVRPIPWVLVAAEKSGVKVVQWAPPWIIPIWEERDKYWLPDAVAQREERKQKMRELGFG